MPPEIHVLGSPEQVYQAHAALTARLLRKALEHRPEATLCLTGGGTAREAYVCLAGEDVEWDRVRFFWGDERAVPPDHDESNFGLAQKQLLGPLGVPPSHTFRMPGEEGAGAGAEAYAHALQAYFGAALPSFDVLHLGMGDDGHTASLFPGASTLDETDRLCVPAQALPDAPVRERITLTLPVLCAAQTVVFGGTGEGKREAFAEVRKAYEGSGGEAGHDADPETLPAARVQPSGALVWIVSQEMAGE